MTKKLTILFTPVNAYGHVNSCVGVAEILSSRGHTIVFMVNQSFKGAFIKRGFQEEIIERDVNGNQIMERDMNEEEKRNSLGYLIETLKRAGLFDDLSAFEKHKNCSQLMESVTREENQIIQNIIKRLKPDVIVVDFISAPAIFKSGIPWVNLISAQILTVIDDPRTPPGWSGLPTYDNSQWKKYREMIKDTIEFSKEKYYQLFKEEGVKRFPDDKLIESPYLNIYAYPKELDYLDERPLPQKWHQFDSFIRLSEQNFDLPEKLKQKSGNLIFLSLGSLGSSNVQLMKRLVNLIADLPFRFIVAKGIFGDQYDLPSNCWGENMVPQIKVLPKVDLVITHGGNNTICETFYFGKPLIVMPMFSDQFDNAQRIQEKGFGIRMNPFQCTKDQLLNGINKLINDSDLNLKMKNISERFKAEVKLGKVGQLIENLVS